MSHSGHKESVKLLSVRDAHLSFSSLSFNTDWSFPIWLDLWRPGCFHSRFKLMNLLLCSLLSQLWNCTKHLGFLQCCQRRRLFVTLVNLIFCASLHSSGRGESDLLWSHPYVAGLNLLGGPGTKIPVVPIYFTHTHNWDYKSLKTGFLLYQGVG